MTLKMKKAAVSWSGGKDSCLSYYQAKNQGHEIKYLLNFISEKYKRCCFHGLSPDLIRRQSELIGLPLAQKEIPGDMSGYEIAFKEAARSIPGIDSLVFGDIYLDEHKKWTDRVCSDLKMTAISPLWGKEALDVVSDFIDSGFRAVIVSAQADKFDRDFVGRTIDKKLVKELMDKRICPCGENGEFHTVVIDGPVFSKPLKIKKSKPVLKKGFWKYWFLDIQEFA